MKFNINDEVRVRLTDVGRAIHRKNHDDLFKAWGARGVMPEYRPPKEDPGGWSTWQLWDLMHEFGRHCYNGAKIPFETEIDIPNFRVGNDIAPAMSGD